MGKYQQNIENARRVGVIDFLQTCRPGELIRVTDKAYRTKTHSSLVISSNGLFHWFSMGVGGNNAIDYLTKVENMDFVSAVRMLNEVAVAPVSFQPARQSARIPQKNKNPGLSNCPRGTAMSKLCQPTCKIVASAQRLSGTASRMVCCIRPRGEIPQLRGLLAKTIPGSPDPLFSGAAAGPFAAMWRAAKSSMAF